MEKFEHTASPEEKEKPSFLFHGSISGDIMEFEPRKRYTPRGLDVPPRVYATGIPAFAAAHSFPWHSGEGVQLSIEEGTVVLKVPENIQSRLAQRVSIYTFDSATFSTTEEDVLGETYHTEESVKPKEVISFNSVTEAMEHFGGRIEIIPVEK